eukprot:TRINITY_DN6931_c0_g1_i5.p1 TRINITY_DN6931_c0_g1~~TRINITY_DN6931_c0_g1_i5.p1  ORF type:complete len:342 (-),score=-18.96 TRINITY_DN6931_c0_g1_i5:977-2002(-)
MLFTQSLERCDGSGTWNNAAITGLINTVRMPRAVPRSDVSAGVAESFMGKILNARQTYCQIRPDKVLELRQQMKYTGCADGGFLAHLGKAGGLHDKRRDGARWCLNCEHATANRNARRRLFDTPRATPARDPSPSLSCTSSEGACTSSEDENPNVPVSRTPQYRKLYKRFKRLKHKILRIPALRLYTKSGSCSEEVQECVRLIRSCGVGQEATGKLLSNIISLLTGRRTKGRYISRKFVEQCDRTAGDLTVLRLLNSVKQACGDDLPEIAILARYQIRHTFLNTAFGGIYTHFQSPTAVRCPITTSMQVRKPVGRPGHCPRMWYSENWPFHPLFSDMYPPP